MYAMTTMPRRQGMYACIGNAQLVPSFNHFSSKFVAIKQSSTTTDAVSIFIKSETIIYIHSFIKETKYFLLN
jgi:hypothetical protein